MVIGAHIPSLNRNLEKSGEVATAAVMHERCTGIQTKLVRNLGRPKRPMCVYVTAAVDVRADRSEPLDNRGRVDHRLAAKLVLVLRWRRHRIMAGNHQFLRPVNGS